jgi:hypothetical protein
VEERVEAVHAGVGAVGRVEAAAAAREVVATAAAAREVVEVATAEGGAKADAGGQVEVMASEGLGYGARRAGRCSARRRRPLLR